MIDWAVSTGSAARAIGAKVNRTAMHAQAFNGIIDRSPY
jgi:hypothetical protein